MKRVLSRSNWRKILVTLVAIGGLMVTYEATTFDLLPWGGQSTAVDPSAPVPGARLQFAATAYCKGTTTASGVDVRTGIAAADDAILPVGSVVNITTDSTKYNGVYTIMDTGPRVQGRALDLYMWSCHEALDFGRKSVQVTVLRLGWNPRASMPSLIDRLFRRREGIRATTNAAPGARPAERTGGVETDGAPRGPNDTLTDANAEAPAAPPAVTQEAQPAP